jgi:hypothetical protein
MPSILAEYPFQLQLFLLPLIDLAIGVKFYFFIFMAGYKLLQNVLFN